MQALRLVDGEKCNEIDPEVHEWAWAGRALPRANFQARVRAEHYPGERKKQNAGFFCVSGGDTHFDVFRFFISCEAFAKCSIQPRQ